MIELNNKIRHAVFWPVAVVIILLIAVEDMNPMSVTGVLSGIACFICFAVIAGVAIFTRGG